MEEHVYFEEEPFVDDSGGIQIKEEPVECEDSWLVEAAVDIKKMEEKEEIYAWNSFAGESDSLDLPINRPSKPQTIPSLTHTVCETIMIRKGGSLTFNKEDGHLYVTNRRYAHRRYYRCSKYKELGCDGRMICDSDNVVVSTTPHNHNHPSESEIEKIRAEGSLRLYTGEKTFRRELCEKKFARGNHLKEHMRTHTVEPIKRPEPGPSQKNSVCETIMTRKRRNLTFNKEDGHLYIINRRIAHRRYYMCRKKIELGCTGRMICDDDNVVVSSTPHNHSRPPESDIENIRAEGLRSDEKRFDCELCESSFNRRGSLKFHMRRHTGEKREIIRPPQNLPSQTNLVCETIMTRKRRKLTFNKGDGHLYIINSCFPNRRYYMCCKKIEFGCPGRMICDGNNVVFSSTPHNHSHPSESEVEKIRREGAHLGLLTGEMPYICEHCKANFTSRSSLKVHIRTHTEETLSRPEPSQTNLETIVTRKKRNVTYYKGDGHLYIINGRFPFRRYYRCTKMKELGCRGRMICDGDNVVVSSTPHNHSHPPESEIEKMRTEGLRRVEKRHNCKYCEANFTSRSSLKVHIRTHTGELINRPEPGPSETNSVCETIVTRRKRKVTFNKGDGHLYVINRSLAHRIYYKCIKYKELGCDGRMTCDGDNVVISTTLHNHSHPPESEIEKIRIEGLRIGEKRFDCELCEANFTRKSTLKDHMKRHTGEKPYECRFCEAKFCDGHSLREHLIIHPKEKPYECQDCKAKFISDTNLKRHLKTHVMGNHFLASSTV